MPASIEVVPGVYRIPIGPPGGPAFVNAFFIEAEDGVTLIDTGIAGSAPRILEGLAERGHGPAEVAGIVITHCHGDHTGSLAELERLTASPVHMHPADAALVCEGISARPMTPSPGVELPPGFGSGGGAPGAVEPLPPSVVHEVADGDVVPLAGGLRALSAPGHTEGHLLFMLPRAGGTLFLGDAASNLSTLGFSIVYEDHERAGLDLELISGLDFENALFSHGEPIVGGADEAFAALWGTS